MELRPYQKEAVKILDNYEGHGVVAIATGLGKTVIAANMQRKGRTLILSHRDELVRQPQKYFNCTFGVEKADEHSNGEEIVSASVQSLYRDERLHTFAPDEFHTIIVDEAHHAAAPTYRKILDYFTGAKRVVGLTATPKRGDGIRLTDVFNEIIFSRDLKWGIENGYLSRVRCKQVFADYSLDKIKKTAGDYNQGDLSRELDSAGALAAAAKAYMEFCYGKNRHTLVYCVSIENCTVLQRELFSLIPEDKHSTIAILTGKTPDDERKAILDGFKVGTILCIINCMVLTEGTDLPIADTILNLRPTCNVSLFAQMIGRGTRLYDGKEYCLILDVIPQDKEKHRSLCTAPTLFGLDPSILPKEKEKLLYEDADLLDTCEELTAECKDIEKKMKIIVQDVEDFLSETREIVSRFGKNMKGLSSAIEDGYSLGPDDPDFGDFYVEKQADASKRYRIQLTYDDEVFLSEPDMLDNVTVCFHIKGYKQKIYTGEMKLTDALELIREYCETLPLYYEYCWNRKTKDLWKNRGITPKQKKRIGTAFHTGDYDLSCLDMLEASRLIDLSCRINDAEKHVKEIRPPKSAKQARKDACREKLLAEIKEKEKLAESGKKEFDSFAYSVRKEYDKEIQRRISEEKKWEKGALQVKSEYLISKGDATDAQISYLVSLKNEAKKNGFTIPETESQLTRRETGLMISFCKILQNYRVPKDMEIIFDADDFSKALEKAEKSGIVDCKIRYVGKKSIVC